MVVSTSPTLTCYVRQPWECNNAMPRENRIWAAHGHREGEFAISIGRMEDNPQFSRIVIWREGEWRVVPLDSTVMAITGVSAGSGAAVTFVALGIDGDVNFLDEPPRRTQIPGGGTANMTGGLGSMTYIGKLTDRLIACGTESQVYRQIGQGDAWERLCDPSRPSVGRNYFASVVGTSPERLAACGFSNVQRRVPTPEENAELEQLLIADPNNEYMGKRRQYRRVEREAGGSLYFFALGVWSPADLPTRQRLKDVAALPGRFVAVGEGGTMILGSNPDDLEDVSGSGPKETLYAVRPYEGQLYVLGQTGIFVYDEAFNTIQTIELPENLSSPMSIDVVDDSIWYFDHDGVARRHGNDWEVLDIPAEYWAGG